MRAARLTLYDPRPDPKVLAHYTRYQHTTAPRPFIYLHHNHLWYQAPKHQMLLTEYCLLKTDQHPVLNTHPMTSVGPPDYIMHSSPTTAVAKLTVHRRPALSSVREARPEQGQERRPLLCWPIMPDGWWVLSPSQISFVSWSGTGCRASRSGPSQGTGDSENPQSFQFNSSTGERMTRIDALEPRITLGVTLPYHQRRSPVWP